MYENVNRMQDDYDRMRIESERMRDHDCECNDHDHMHEDRLNNSSILPVMAYVPVQVLRDVFPTEKALDCGTLFPELYKPFLGIQRGGGK